MTRITREDLTALARGRPKFFFGWWMVALGGLVSSINKTAVNRGFAVFLLPVEEYFGISRATVSLIFSLGHSQSGPTGPLAGWLVDRFGPRAMLFVGATLCGVGFLILGFTRSLWAFAAIYLGIITVGTNIGFIYPMADLLNNWFYRKKAIAMSTFHAVDSIIPALLVPVLALALLTWGLDRTVIAMGVILLVTVLPLAFFIRDTPESMGLTMDGDSPDRPQRSPRGAGRMSRATTQPAEYGLQAAMRTPAYWVLVLGTSFRLVAKSAVLLHIIPIFVSKGLDQPTAALAFSVYLLITIPMYLAIGWLGDRFPKNWVLMGAALSGTVSFVLLALPFQSLWVVLMFVILFAVAEASAPTNWAALGEYFGRRTFSRLRGFVQLANFPPVMLAPVFVGWWFDVHGGYVVPLWIFAAVFGLCALTFGLMRGPAQQSETLI